MEREANRVNDSNIVPALIICSLKIPGICYPAVDKVKQFLQQRQCDSSHLVVIGSSDLAERSRTAFEFFVQLFRHHGLHRNERVTVLGAIDQLIAVQLVLASQNKKNLGDFSVDNSQVLHINDRLTRWKISTAADNLEISSDCHDDHNFSEFVQQYNGFLQHCNVVDWMDVANCVATELRADSELQKCLLMSDFLIFCNEDDLIERHFIQLLAKQRKCFNISIALSLNESFSDKLTPESADLTIEGCLVDEALSSLSTCTQSSASMSELLAEQVIAAYLELLVNSRNELALARVINVPDRKLDHVAFTDIKHEAECRNMSMYQTVLSFVMRIRLGGKSYAPASDCPLVQYTEGLGNFNDLMQKLQTVVEEEVVPELAAEKVVRILKLRISKSSNLQIRTAALDVIAARLMDKVLMIQKMTSVFPVASPISDARNGGSIVGRRTLRLIRSVLDHCNSLPTRLRDADVLNDVFSTSQKTPIRLPSLISKFRSPEDCNESRTIKRPLEEPDAKNQPRHSIHDKSHVRDYPAGILTERTTNSANCLISSDKSSSCQPLQRHTEHSMKKFSPDENDCRSNTTPSKRPKNFETNKENLQEKKKNLCSNAPKKPIKKTVKAKVIPLAKGQQKLNAFFRI